MNTAPGTPVNAMKLSPLQRAQITGMLRRGDRQMDIALWFGVSPSTVNKIKRRRDPEARSVLAEGVELPPPGPYAVVARAELDEDKLKLLVAERLVAELRHIVDRYTSLASGL